MQKLLLSLILFFLVVLTFTLFFFFYEARFFTGRAAGSNQIVSIDNSYVFVTPLQAKGDGQQKVRITVFVLNNQGMGVASQKVIVRTDDAAVIIDELQPLTDSLGKAVFDAVSAKPGDYYVEVEIEGKSLLQKAHLSFN